MPAWSMFGGFHSLSVNSKPLTTEALRSQPLVPGLRELHQFGDLRRADISQPTPGASVTRSCVSYGSGFTFRRQRFAGAVVFGPRRSTLHGRRSTRCRGGSAPSPAHALSAARMAADRVKRCPHFWAGRPETGDSQLTQAPNTPANRGIVRKRPKRAKNPHVHSAKKHESLSRRFRRT